MSSEAIFLTDAVCKRICAQCMFQMPKSALPGLHRLASQHPAWGVRQAIHTMCFEEKPCALQDGSTPLHYAAAFGQSHIIRALVDAGCPVDSRDDAQNTPLHLAAGILQPAYDGHTDCR